MGIPHLREWIELAGQGIEALAVLVMVAFIVLGTVRWVVYARMGVESGYTAYRVTVGRALLVGLELLVAADVIRTVALQSTLMNLAALGVLVIIRTALGWSVTLEVEGRWPWQSKRVPADPRRAPD
jgi:uncharacterized membrane protein